MKYKVFIDDNFHFMDESERVAHGEYSSCEMAIKECQKIVDDYLESAYEAGMTADQLYESYTGFGDDPFIKSEDKKCEFSAWKYAKSRCKKLIDSKTVK